MQRRRHRARSAGSPSGLPREPGLECRSPTEHSSQTRSVTTPTVSPGSRDTRRRIRYLSWPPFTAPVSNGNIALMTDIARRNGMRFDAILGADIAQDYKPKARVYRASAEAFDLKPSECMMVLSAAHDGDAVGAAKAGLRTAAVSRPDEFGPGKSSPTPKAPVDILAKDLNDLADKLGA